ncbi:MAG: hypothetical protein HZB14_00215 [Actinobacteria bacterium]|nr:hypothetical protein [Actinomycetota bacterium]
MRLRVEIFTRAAIAVALVAFAAAATGCGGDSAKLPVHTIYLSVPQHGELASRGDDMEDAVRLALDQTNYDTPDVRIEFVALDSLDPKAARRRAFDDPKALAFISFRNPAGSERASSSGRSGNLLRISLEPAEGSGSGFDGDAGGRVEASAEGLINLLPSAADSGEAIAQAVEQPAPRRAEMIAGSSRFAQDAQAGFLRAIGDTAVKYSAKDPAKGATGFNVVADGERVYGADRPQAPDPSEDSPGTLVTPALAPAGYPHGGEKFFEWFENAYERQPDRWAVWAYEAVGLALNAITDAGETGEPVTRDSVRKAAFGITNRFGPVGHYDVLADGSTTIYTFGIREWPLDPEAEVDDPRVIEVNR